MTSDTNAQSSKCINIPMEYIDYDETNTSTTGMGTISDVQDNPTMRNTKLTLLK